MFGILLRQKLSPKLIVKKWKLNNLAFSELLSEIKLKFQESVVNIGEAVGVIAAQSIGEPCTQMTLNSVTYDTEVIIRDQEKKIQKIKIGDFTTLCIKKNDN